MITDVDGTRLFTGVVDVTTAGTRVQLSATAQGVTSSVRVKAKDGNTGAIYVGGSTVSSTTGYALAKGESVEIKTKDLAYVWIDAATSGDGVTYLAT